MRRLLQFTCTTIRGQLIVFLLVSFSPFDLSAQELEPRALTNIPPGFNFAVAAYAYSEGNILIDPSIPIEDFDGRIHGAALAYARSIKLFGHYAKVDAVLPMADGAWTGKLNGEEQERAITGFADMRLRLSMNFIGGKIGRHDINTPVIGGASIQVIAPTGQYEADDLVNLGANRWTVRTQVGVARQFKKWIVELYAGIWLFTKNDAFLGNGTIGLAPFGVLKTHLIRKLRSKDWLAFDIGYGIGANPTVDGNLRDARISSMRTGFTYAFNFDRKHVIRASVFSSIRFEKGPDFDSLALSYLYTWMKKKSNPRIPE